MPAIFYLSLPPAGESGTGAEGRSKAEGGDGDVLGYSGHLSFDGGFDRYGFVPRRTYPGADETAATPPQPDSDS